LGVPVVKPELLGRHDFYKGKKKKKKKKKKKRT